MSELPKISDILNDQEMKDGEVYNVSTVIYLLKKYGEAVRNKTLEVAADNADTDQKWNCEYDERAEWEPIVNKNSILDLWSHEELKIE